MFLSTPLASLSRNVYVSKLCKMEYLNPEVMVAN